MPAIGTIYNGGMFPIPIERHNLLREAYGRYLDWRAYGKDEIQEMDFDLIRQYLIYHIHAPCWMFPYDLEGEEATPILKLCAQALEIKDWDGVQDYVLAALDYGLDPL